MIWEIGVAPPQYKAVVRDSANYVAYIVVGPKDMWHEFLLYNELDFAFEFGRGHQYELDNGNVLITIG